jgi:hypothetical protein
VAIVRAKDHPEYKRNSITQLVTLAFRDDRKTVIRWQCVVICRAEFLRYPLKHLSRTASE